MKTLFLASALGTALLLPSPDAPQTPQPEPATEVVNQNNPASPIDPTKTQAVDEMATKDIAPPPIDMKAEIKRLNTFVRSIRTIRGDFIQTADNGSLETGSFYWKRPGKLRIEYQDSPLLIVADGSNIAQIDKDLETIDQVRISWTPYKFLLSRRFDLTKGMELVGIQKHAEQTRVTVRDPDGEMDGEFTLVFAEPQLALLGWTWTNPYDGQVDFTLTNTVKDTKLASALFVIREQDRRRGGRRR